uniref:Uncharacterized protein n=1 Tax=Arundo donax TaxID=35708 RepID=A0A0A9AW59_ARUDO
MSSANFRKTMNKSPSQFGLFTQVSFWKQPKVTDQK